MSNIDLQSIRSKTGLSEAEFLIKISPFLRERNSRLTVGMLRKLENGEMLREDRMDEVIASIRDSFPEFSDTTIVKKTANKSLKMLPNHVAMIIFVAISAIACGLYFYFDLKDIVNDSLTVVASIAGIMALVLAIYKVVS